MSPAVYPPATPLDLAAGLEVDPEAAEAIAAWFELVADGLGRFASRHQDESPTDATLWPEHFDLALTIGEVNYGGSPGDARHPGPYVYVGPLRRAPARSGTSRSARSAARARRSRRWTTPWRSSMRAGPKRGRGVRARAR